MMNKKTTQNGVLISGSEKSDKETPPNKGKRSNEGKNTKKLKENEASKSTKYKDSENPSHGQFTQGKIPKKEQAVAEGEELNQDKEEHGGTTSEPNGKKIRICASPKPQKP